MLADCRRPCSCCALKEYPPALNDNPARPENMLQMKFTNAKLIREMLISLLISGLVELSCDHFLV